MLLNKKIIFCASYGAALYDNILSVPDKNKLEIITYSGLHRFLPQWINMNTGAIDERKLERRVLQTIASSYPLPQEFQQWYAQEQREIVPDSILNLNYLLLTEILSTSPQGKVNPLVYKLSCGRVNKQIGMNTLRKISEEILERITDPEERRYFWLNHTQMLQTQQRFVDELPLLEHLLQTGGFPQDLSEVNIEIYGLIRGKLEASPFL